MKRRRKERKKERKKERLVFRTVRAVAANHASSLASLSLPRPHHSRLLLLKKMCSPSLLPANPTVLLSGYSRLTRTGLQNLEMAATASGRRRDDDEMGEQERKGGRGKNRDCYTHTAKMMVMKMTVRKKGGKGGEARRGNHVRKETFCGRRRRRRRILLHGFLSIRRFLIVGWKMGTRRFRVAGLDKICLVVREFKSYRASYTHIIFIVCSKKK